jgi:hypothetical protein
MHPSNVASPTKNPIVIVAIKVHDIEPLKESGWTNVMMKGMMKADTVHATDKTLMKALESVE